MSGSYLLDTNIVIAFFSGESAVIDKFARADEILLPSIVLGGWPLEHASPAARQTTWHALKISANKLLS